MTCQLQEKKKAIEDVSNTINNGYVLRYIYDLFICFYFFCVYLKKMQSQGSLLSWELQWVCVFDMRTA